MKSILKEIAIIILLCLAIGLALVIAFYSYLPKSIVIPSSVEAYTTSNSIKDEINQEVAEYPKQNIVFEITDSDLTLYKQSESYDPGKADPFAVETENSTAVTTNGQASTSTSQTTNTVTAEKSNNQSSTNTFFQDTKLK